MNDIMGHEYKTKLILLFVSLLIQFTLKKRENFLRKSLHQHRYNY